MFASVGAALESDEPSVVDGAVDEGGGHVLVAEHASPSAEFDVGLLKAGLVTSKKAAKVERTAKKSRVQAREARAAVEENKKAQLERDKQLSEQQKQAALAKEYKAQVKQLIEMNRITIANGDIGFNFTDGNLIKKIFVDKLTQAQLINGRLAIARLLVDNNSEGEYAIIPASVADKIAQRDASSIVLHSALSAEEQDEDDPYADFKVPDDLMW